MSEVADKLCAAIEDREKEVRAQLLGTLRFEMPIHVLEKERDRFLDQSFQREFIRKIDELLYHLFPGSCVRIPNLQAGLPSCFLLDRTPGGLVKMNVSIEAFVFPEGGPK